MRRLRSLARAIACLLPLAATACLDDAPVAPGAGGSALRIEARLSASQVEQTLRVRAYFVHRETEARVDLPVSPGEISVDSEEDAERRVTTQLARCFAEGAVPSEGGEYCPLRVELMLLDGEGEEIARQMHEVQVRRGDNPVLVPAFSFALASVSGTVVSAVTGAGLGGVQVGLFLGATPTGNPLATATTASTGAYEFNDVEPGTYALQVSGQGLNTTSDVVVVEGAEPVQRDLVATPVVAQGEIRVVLTWGANPADLDSHLWGPPAAATTYHVYFQRPSVAPFAVLDVDDTNGHGPETVTITQVVSGRHLYAVHHFAGTGSIATSGARVQVFGPTGLLATYTPPNEAGTLWIVFELNGTNLTQINDIVSVEPTDAPPTTTVGELQGSASRTHAPRPAKHPLVPR